MNQVSIFWGPYRGAGEGKFMYKKLPLITFCRKKKNSKVLVSSSMGFVMAEMCLSNLKLESTLTPRSCTVSQRGKV